MYSNYDFCIYWEDLPEDFREEKIDEVIKKRYGARQFSCNKDETEAQCLENVFLRDEIESWIKVHFPMYF